jgi:hypothetical protein
MNQGSSNRLGIEGHRWLAELPHFLQEIVPEILAHASVHRRKNDGLLSSLPITWTRRRTRKSSCK